MRQSFLGLANLFLILVAATSAVAQVEQPAPLPNTFVHDFAGVIPGDKRVEIQAKAQRLKDEFQTEIAVVTVASLGGEDSFDYSMRLARSWGIGSKDDDVRGLLILVAVEDRKTAFRTSRHIEGELPDGVTGDISRQMNGYFKNGDFGGGLSLGMSKIIERLSEVYQPIGGGRRKAGGSFIWLGLSIAGASAAGIILLLVRRSRRRQREAERKRAEATARARKAYFVPVEARPRDKNRKRRRRGTAPKGHRKSPDSSAYMPAEGGDGQPSSSTSYSSSSSSSSDSGSHYDPSPSSSDDSGSSYSGGSDFGGGGSDSSW